MEEDMVTMSPGLAMTRGMSIEQGRTTTVGTMRPFVVEYMKNVQDSLKTIGVETSSIISDGAPADRILDFARENPVDLIAMSTHGWTGIGRWFFGSITEKVIHTGDKPVLVVRPGVI
jgi:nucleotide-binding universal stress UspA family protein